MSTNLSEIIGNRFVSQRERNAYMLSKGGSFGNFFFIDTNKLRMNILNVKDEKGNSVMNNVIDFSFIDLIANRYNPKVDYTLEAKDIFRDLTKFSGLEKSRKSGKQTLFNGGTVTFFDFR